jgi:hypothetical protein
MKQKYRPKPRHIRSAWSVARAIREQQNGYAAEFLETHTLRYEDGTAAQPGDLIGDDLTLVKVLAPRKPGSTGRVIVAERTGELVSYFPCVIAAHWEPR